MTTFRKIAAYHLANGFVIMMATAVPRLRHGWATGEPRLSKNHGVFS